KIAPREGSEPEAQLLLGLAAADGGNVRRPTVSYPHIRRPVRSRFDRQYVEAQTPPLGGRTSQSPAGRMSHGLPPRPSRSISCHHALEPNRGSAAWAAALGMVDDQSSSIAAGSSDRR